MKRLVGLVDVSKK